MLFIQTRLNLLLIPVIFISMVLTSCSAKDPEMMPPVSEENPSESPTLNIETDAENPTVRQPELTSMVTAFSSENTVSNADGSVTFDWPRIRNGNTQDFVMLNIVNFTNSMNGLCVSLGMSDHVDFSTSNVSDRPEATDSRVDAVELDARGEIISTRPMGVVVSTITCS